MQHFQSKKKKQYKTQQWETFAYLHFMTIFLISNKLVTNIPFQKYVKTPRRNEFDIVNISTLFLVNVKLSPDNF